MFRAVGPECSRIYVIDDACPEHSGRLVEDQGDDPRVSVYYNERNLGVGGAVIRGYRQAIEDGASVIVKLDGDGQMDPRRLSNLVRPILAGRADYAKGNRFYDLDRVRAMPRVRIAGNLVLSFMAKLSTGYWSVFDPTNGYTAIHAKVASRLPLDKVSNRFFFETDLLFRLGLIRAVVVDIPMDAEYHNELSNLKIRTVVGEFAFKHLRNAWKRIVYSYFLRDFSLASLELVVGIALSLFGLVFGFRHWMQSYKEGVVATAGTVMLAAVPFLLGMQYILAFLAFDTASSPRDPLHPRLDG
jgi:glycosyltransferase involved in cell wall biosynthesis